MNEQWTMQFKIRDISPYLVVSGSGNKRGLCGCVRSRAPWVPNSPTKPFENKRWAHLSGPSKRPSCMSPLCVSSHLAECHVN
ncbi:hypothetical protein IMZ48_00195 [Candidatus Bathyarchaeota archaeon]|nr:hypothetical protein [Candidatus Bathyarchaeota archaeon]